MIKPLVGAADDGPGDAAVIVPVRGSTRGLAVGCGIEPALRQDRPLSHGGLRHRRGDSQLRRRGRRSRANRAPRQFLLGQHRAARDSGLAGPGGRGMPRHRPGVRNAVHLGQGQSLQRIHARWPEPGDPAHALDQRHRPGARHPPVRDDGFQGTGQPDSASGSHPSRAGGVDLGRPTISPARAASPGSTPRWAGVCSPPCTRRSVAAWSEAVTI